MKKNWFIVGETLSEALCEGAALFPNMIFAGLVFMHQGELRYLLPCVLLYAFEKAALFYIAGKGNIGNPHRMLKILLYIAMTGIVAMDLGRHWQEFWLVGAALLGIGLCGFSPLYRALRDRLREKGTWQKDTSLIAGYLLFAMFLGLIWLLRYGHLRIIFTLLFFYLAGVAFFLQKTDVSALDLPDRLWVNPKQGWIRFLLPVGVLVIMLAVSLFQQTAGPKYLLLMAAALVLTLMAVRSAKGIRFRACAARCMWYGAVRNFLSIFSLICLSAMGQSLMVMAAYTMAVLGVVLARTITAPLMRFAGEKNFETACIIGASCSLLLMLPANRLLYLLAVALSSMFAAAGSVWVGNSYLADETIPQTDRRLVNYKIYSLGAVMQQAIMMLLIALAACICRLPADVPMDAYTNQTGSTALLPVFTLACWLCVLTLCLFGAVVIRYGKETEG